MEFINSTKDFYEIICISEPPKFRNDPITKKLELLIKTKKFILRPKYFDLALTDKNHYLVLNNIGVRIYNFRVLLLNRSSSKIIFISSNVDNLSAALLTGCCIIPLPNNTDSAKCELQFAENYLMMNRWSHRRNPKPKNEEDFNFLT